MFEEIRFFILCVEGNQKNKHSFGCPLRQTDPSAGMKRAPDPPKASRNWLHGQPEAKKPSKQTSFSYWDGPVDCFKGNREARKELPFCREATDSQRFRSLDYILVETMALGVVQRVTGFGITSTRACECCIGLSPWSMSHDMPFEAKPRDLPTVNLALDKSALGVTPSKRSAS